VERAGRLGGLLERERRRGLAARATTVGAATEDQGLGDPGDGRFEVGVAETRFGGQAVDAERVVEDQSGDQCSRIRHHVARSRSRSVLTEHPFALTSWARRAFTLPVWWARMAYVLVLGVGLAAGTISGIIGTGASIMLVPVLVLAFGPKQAVPIMAIAAVM